MKHHIVPHSIQGISIIEVILASALFVIFATGAVTTILQGFYMNRNGAENTIATQYASEGIEAMKSIKRQNFALLTNTNGTGVTRNINGVWSLNGPDNSFGRYTRILTIEDVYRDVSGNIVGSGGTLDALTKKITSTVTWTFSTGRVQTIALSSYVSNWSGAGKKGMLVYTNGGTTSDAILFKIYDDTTSSWTTAQSTADIDGTSTNRYLRNARVYASPTRNEKILVSRHYNGTTQYIYAQVYNGTTWGNVQLLSNWNAGTFLDVQNFDGTYLNNGDFMVAFSDNTTIPKFRTWNGTSWSAQVSMNGLAGAPLHIVLRARPTSNEVMFTVLDSANDTEAEYFNGGAYSTGNWTTRVTHAANTVTNTKRIIDFAWSLNSPLTGALIFANASNDKSFRGVVYVANGTGGGTWGSVVSAANQTNNLGAMSLSDRPTANEFIACNKDGGGTPTIVCRKLAFSGTTVTWTTPTNPIVASATDTGIQKSVDVRYEIGASARALITYGDNTNVPKFKLYDPTTSTISASATSISMTPYTLGSPVRTIREIVEPVSGTLMTLIADNSLDLYSLTWNGSSFSSATQHGISGSASTDYWYDFVWDAN